MITLVSLWPYANITTGGNITAYPVTMAMAYVSQFSELCRNEATRLRMPRVTRSPKLAAIGVATLSGLIPCLCETEIVILYI